MECVATDKEEVVKLAEPLLTATGEPILATPSLNCTVPVWSGEATVGDDRLTVKVSGSPNSEGLLLEVTAVTLEALPTISVTADGWFKLLTAP